VSPYTSLLHVRVNPTTAVQAVSIGSDEEEESAPGIIHKSLRKVSKVSSQTTKACTGSCRKCKCLNVLHHHVLVKSTIAIAMSVSVESEAEDENDTLGVGHKSGHKVLKATKNKSRAEPVTISDMEEDFATDDGGAVEPLTTRGLKRSYAMLDILDTTGGENTTDAEFEPPSESELTSAGIVELDDSDKETPKKKAVKPWVRKATSVEIIELDDEDETPKKKKVKPTVREAIKAKQGQLGQVCFVDSRFESLILMRLFMKDTCVNLLCLTFCLTISPYFITISARILPEPASKAVLSRTGAHWLLIRLPNPDTKAREVWQNPLRLLSSLKGVRLPHPVQHGSRLGDLMI